SRCARIVGSSNSRSTRLAALGAPLSRASTCSRGKARRASYEAKCCKRRLAVTRPTPSRERSARAKVVRSGSGIRSGRREETGRRETRHSQASMHERQKVHLLKECIHG